MDAKAIGGSSAAISAATRLRQCKPWRQAVTVLFGILCNSLWLAGMAVGFTYLLSLGDIFSKKAPAQQSLLTFVTGAMATTAIASVALNVIVSVNRLDGVRFVDSPTKGLSFFRRLHRFLRRMWFVGVVLIAITCSAVYAFGTASEMNLTHAKAQLYVAVVMDGCLRSCVYVANKSVFQRDTIEGRALQHVNHAPFVVRMAASFKVFRVYILVHLLGAGYIHATSTFQSQQTTTELILFALSGWFVKALLNWLIVRYTQKHHKMDPVIVYTQLIPPATLIETQVRVAMLRFQAPQQLNEAKSYRLAQLGLFGCLGIFEIAFRVWKLRRLQHRLTHRRPSMRQIAPVGPTAAETIAPSIPHPHVSAKTVMPAPLQRPSSRSLRSLNTKRNEELFLFAASTLAEMYAEYAAIICATGVFVFWHNHPKFSLGDDTIGATDASSSMNFAANMTNFVGTVYVQVAVEVAVDWVCSAIEIAYDVPLIPPQRIQWLVRGLLLGCGLANISLCAFGYIAAHHH